MSAGPSPKHLARSSGPYYFDAPRREIDARPGALPALSGLDEGWSQSLQKLGELGAARA